MSFKILDSARLKWVGLHPRSRMLLAAGSILVAIAIAVGVFRQSATEPVEAANAGPMAVGDTAVRLDSAAQRLAGIELVAVTAAASGELTANGTITYDANRVSIVSSSTEARVVGVRADLGQRVAAGSVLAVLTSSDIGQTRGDLQRERANLDVARKNYERERRLFSQQISPQRDLLEAEGAFRSAQADYTAARSKLRSLGATTGEGGTFGLVSPVSGTVVERKVSPGLVVGPSNNLFTVADLSRVWITVNVFEADMPRLREGAEAIVIPTALAGEAFKGRVTYAGGIVDSASHTFEARVEVENGTRKLRPGMFAQVKIKTPLLGGPQGSLLIPEISIQDLNGKTVVFVAGRMPGEFLARKVTRGPQVGQGMVAILAGLVPGEKVVTKGSFQIKAELMKASFAEED